MNDGLVIAGRTLTTMPCAGGCGLILQQFVAAGEKCRCSECSDNTSRKVNGWTPTNSRD